MMGKALLLQPNIIKQEKDESIKVIKTFKRKQFF